jgi:Protein of unknown function (DUF1579)
MKRAWLVLLLVALPLSADDPLDFYVENAKPVAEHKTIAELAGPWKVTTTLWFDPNGAPKVGKGEGAGRIILGGRFVELDTKVSGDFPSHSIHIFGFDRRTSEFTLIGLDDLATYSITAAGKRDAAKNAIVLDGSYKQPQDGKDQSYRFVWTRPAANEHLLTLYFIVGGKDVRVAETRLVR